VELSHWNSPRVGLPFVLGDEIITNSLNSIGDVIDAFMALMVLRTCEQIEGGLPSHIKAKMWFNIVLDFGIGLTPIIGDIAGIDYAAPLHSTYLLLSRCPISRQHPKCRSS
jgi:hypothetical protein